MASFNSAIDVEAKVLIDGDKSIVATVTAVIFRKLSTSYEVSYLHNGSLYSPTVEDWRITRAPY